MVAAGTVSAARQEDAAAGYGGGFSRTAAALLETGVPQGCGSADPDPQTRLYRKPDVIESVFDTMARSETCCEAGEQAGHTSRGDVSPMVPDRVYLACKRRHGCDRGSPYVDHVSR